MPAQVIFGNIADMDADELRTTLKANGLTRMDTAARYQDGESEKKIGAAKLANDFVSAFILQGDQEFRIILTPYYPDD